MATKGTGHLARREFLRDATAAGIGALSFGTFGASLLKTMVVPQPGDRGPRVYDRPINIVVLGDSYMWGQGLRTQDKYYIRVQGRLQGMLGDFRVVRAPFVYARSGAKIAVQSADDTIPLPGSKADAFWETSADGAPSITSQVRRACTDLLGKQVRPEEVDLVLVDGGGNDVGIKNILSVDPTVGVEWVSKLTRERCGDQMKQLLPLILDGQTGFANAKVVVVGYPPAISGSTDLSMLGQYLSALGILAVVATLPVGIGLLVEARRKLAAQSTAFAEVAATVLTEAVNEANATPVGHGRVAFADIRPYWQDENALGAPNAYLWPVALPPADPVAADRFAECVKQKLETDVTCVDASMGHPNAQGAAAHATAVESAIRPFGYKWLGLGEIKLRMEPVQVMDGRPTTVTIFASDVEKQTPLAVSVSVDGATHPANVPFTHTFTAPSAGRPPAKLGVSEDRNDPGSGSFVYVAARGYVTATLRPTFSRPARAVVTAPAKPPPPVLRRLTVAVVTTAKTATTKTIVVTATDATSGQPVAGAVTIDGKALGQTGATVAYKIRTATDILTDARGRPIPSTRTKEEISLGRVDAPGYEPASFTP